MSSVLGCVAASFVATEGNLWEKLSGAEGHCEGTVSRLLVMFFRGHEAAVCWGKC